MQLRLFTLSPKNCPLRLEARRFCGSGMLPADLLLRCFDNVASIASHYEGFFVAIVSSNGGHESLNNFSPLSLDVIELAVWYFYHWKWITEGSASWIQVTGQCDRPCVGVDFSYGSLASLAVRFRLRDSLFYLLTLLLTASFLNGSSSWWAAM